jgi:hypothetical protein
MKPPHLLEAESFPSGTAKRVERQLGDVSAALTVFMVGAVV